MGGCSDRAAGRRIPWSTIEPRWLRYDEGARYGTYVERLFAAVGRERSSSSCSTTLLPILRDNTGGCSISLA